MFTEKVAALSEALAVATSATLGGSNGARTAKRVLNVYRSRVRSNQRRLSR
jgi:hypothetical protein